MDKSTIKIIKGGRIGKMKSVKVHRFGRKGKNEAKGQS